MENVKTKPMTFRTSEEIRADFKATYEASGATSQNEFLGMLLKKWIKPESTENTEQELESSNQNLNLSQEETQEIFSSSLKSSDASSIDEFLDQLLLNFNSQTTEENEQEPLKDQTLLLDNEILFSLNPAQEYALRETVLSNRFAENQNDTIDEKRKGDFYSGDLSTTPEFKDLCIRNVVLTEDMTPELKELSTLHNMAVLPVNRFLIRLVHGDLYDKKITKLRKSDLKAFIQDQNLELPFEFSVRTINSGLQRKDIVLRLSPVQIFALRETVLSKEDFADEQNRMTDSLMPENKPFLYFGNLFEPEFRMLWVKNISLTDDLTPEQKESAIRHNMSAFLLNMFFVNFVEEHISDSKVSAGSLKSFIQKNDLNLTVND